jgi:hypothetical protein
MNKALRLAIALLFLAATVASAQTRNIGGKNKIRYDEFEWMTYDTPHFQISYYDRVESELDRVASFAESSYDDLARRLNFQILEPIPLILFASHAEFQQTNVIVGFIPEGVGAFATPVRNRMVMPVDLPDRELQALIQHELTHIFQYEILFQGRRSRAIYKRPPLWYMEGMASYLGNDEDSLDQAFMRDAVLSDRVPSIAAQPSGFFAYRYGNKVFEFVEAEWGEDGLRDFIFAFRNTMSGSIAGPIDRVFNMTVEEFDGAFRAWLRKKYEIYGDRSRPQEFGPIFRADRGKFSQESSPVASPSGDLVAAFTTVKNDVDIAVFGVPDRTLFKNLTRGNTNKYEYLIAQGFTIGPSFGRDLSFSPDGTQVAAFGRTERSRSLFIFDVYERRIAARYDIPLPIDQAGQPAFSPDGSKVAFSAVRYGQFDIFEIDLDTEEIKQLTDTEAFDASPVYDPDGSRLIFTTQEGIDSKLGELSLDGSGERRQITFGPGSDDYASFSLDGKRLYFASDRYDQVWDVFYMDLESGTLHKMTDVIGAAINPTPVKTLDGERVVFQAYSRGTWQLYIGDPNQAEEIGQITEPSVGLDLDDFVPSVSLAIDPERGEEVRRKKLYLEDLSVNVGVDQDGNLLSYTFASLSDQYGDRRVNVFFDSIDTFSNVRISYTNLERRLAWGVVGYDDRSFFLTGYDPLRDEFAVREETFRRTGVSGFLQYPISRHTRIEGSIGYDDRSAGIPIQTDDGVTITRRDDQVPLGSLGLVGDTTRYRYYGPHSGNRWVVRGFFGADLDEGGTLYRDFNAEWRGYLPITQRAEIAVRVWSAFSDGNAPNVYSFGGYDTLRGYRTRGIAGNRGAFANIEWRFPLVDRLDLSFLRVGEIRGRAFFDIGAAWYNFGGQQFNFRGEPEFVFYGEKIGDDGTVYCADDDRLCDGVASYGVGFTVWLFGLPMHWDFVQRWDGKDAVGDTESQFWIGLRF